MIDSCYCFNPRLLEKQLHQKYGEKRQRRGEFFVLDDVDVIEVLEIFKTRRGTVVDKECFLRA